MSFTETVTSGKFLIKLISASAKSNSASIFLLTVLFTISSIFPSNKKGAAIKKTISNPITIPTILSDFFHIKIIY
ncbi:hypothetical protein [Formosa algae]|uniref:hypothetical protein n=1 Tax=Formosa algae TaxID=225843 RepID=UPI00209BC2C1|nr:hypothetical protein [Formosa algae]